MMGIIVNIHNIKGIDDFEFEIPSEKGLYAIAGENGIGKSTIMSCAACSFFNVTLNDYFGKPRQDSRIQFTYGNNWKIIESKDGEWLNSRGNLNITGFFEGSIVFGNRFKDVDYSLLSILSNIDEKKVVKASSFVSKNLGLILRNDENAYDDLYLLNQKTARSLNLKRKMFFIKRNGSLINQLNMSTGENLLVTILSSLEVRLQKAVYGSSPTFVYLDEIELALHPSALTRLVNFFQDIAKNHNFMILFSTHSVNILRKISASNIFYLQKYNNGMLTCVNPCYPAFATRSLEASTYGFDFLILVEDSLAKEIVNRVILEDELLTNKRILVQPIGGWQQVLRYAYDIITSHLVPPITKILIILDQDIKKQVPEFLRTEKIGFETNPSYLPIKSLEKYLLDNLIKNTDTKLFQFLTNYIFTGKTLNEIITEYDKSIKHNPPKDKSTLSNGKSLFGYLRSELKHVNKTESNLIECVVKYLFNENKSGIIEFRDYLKNVLV